MDYDVALSFAGEDREYVDQVAGYLRSDGVCVFYDKYEQVDLWGKDLYEHLSDVYQDKARYTIMFVSRNYSEKLWPRHERRNAQARAFRESQEYILPARFDDTEVPGLPSTVGYLDLRNMSPERLAATICEKLVSSGVALKPRSSLSLGAEVPAVSPSTVTVTVLEENGQPISGVTVVLVAENGTYLKEQTSIEGKADFDVAKRRMLTVFCARQALPAYLGPEFDPISDLNVTLPQNESVGSLVSLGGWDAIPGLKGMVSPIHDSSNRLYTYTKNIAIEGGQPQPVSFETGKPLHFEDSEGQERYVTFVAVIGSCFLVEYRIP